MKAYTIFLFLFLMPYHILAQAGKISFPEYSEKITYHSDRTVSYFPAKHEDIPSRLKGVGLFNFAGLICYYFSISSKELYNKIVVSGKYKDKPIANIDSVKLYEGSTTITNSHISAEAYLAIRRKRKNSKANESHIIIYYKVVFKGKKYPEIFSSVVSYRRDSEKADKYEWQINPDLKFKDKDFAQLIRVMTEIDYKFIEILLGLRKPRSDEDIKHKKSLVSAEGNIILPKILDLYNTDSKFKSTYFIGKKPEGLIFN